MLVSNYKKFKLECEVAIDTDNVNESLLDLILESLKMDFKSVLNKHGEMCSDMIYSKDVNCSEIGSGDEV